MNKSCIYNVAGHCFRLIMPEAEKVWQCMSNYSPFVDNTCNMPLFTLTLCDTLSQRDNAVAIVIDPNPNPEEAKIDVYRTDCGHLFELTPHLGSNQHSFLHLHADLHTAELLLQGNEFERFCGVNTALMLCYLLATARLDTALMHASAVINNGQSYLFLGRSGTGKSTHSHLWQQYIDGTELLNDDHPIIRIHEQGEAIVYGSPWSGKTPCYRNESAPVGGIIRIKRSLQNHIRQLPPIEAYASLLTSCSGMTWDKELGDAKDRTLQKMVMAIPCYTLECLPDEAAARLCAQTVRKEAVCNE